MRTIEGDFWRIILLLAWLAASAFFFLFRHDSAHPGVFQVIATYEGLQTALHFLFFIAVGFSVSAGRRGARLSWRLVAAAALLAALAEGWQAFSPSREANLDDFLWNEAGVATGVLMGVTLRLPARLGPADSSAAAEEANAK